MLLTLALAVGAVVVVLQLLAQAAVAAWAGRASSSSASSVDGYSDIQSVPKSWLVARTFRMCDEIATSAQMTSAASHRTFIAHSSEFAPVRGIGGVTPTYSFPLPATSCA